MSAINCRALRRSLSNARTFNCIPSLYKLRKILKKSGNSFVLPFALKRFPLRVHLLKVSLFLKSFVFFSPVETIDDSAYFLWEFLIFLFLLQWSVEKSPAYLSINWLIYFRTINTCLLILCRSDICKLLKPYISGNTFFRYFV